MRSGRFWSAAAWLVSLVLLGYAWLMPSHSFDLAPYVGLLVSLDARDAPDAQIRMDRALYENLNGQDYRRIVRADHLTTPGWNLQRKYLESFYKEPANFAQQLRFYQGRPLFLMLARFFQRIGFGPIDAIRLVSVFGFGLLMLATWRWLEGVTTPVQRFWLWLGILSASGAVVVARMDTPDALLAGCLSWAILRQFQGDAKRTTLWWLAAIAVRPDSLPMVMMLAIVALQTTSPRRRLRLRRYLLGGLTALVSALLIVKLSQHPGWSALIAHTFIAPINDLSTWKGSIAAGDYIKWLFERSMASGAAIGLAMVAFVGCFFAQPRGEALIAVWMALAVALGACIRFLFFPMLDERFTLPVLWSSLMALALCLAHLAPPPQRSTKREMADVV